MKTYKIINFFLLLAVVGMSFLPPQPGLLREKVPFDLQSLQPEEEMDCHCESHEELVQVFRQHGDFSGKIAYMVSCSSAAVDYTLSSLKLMMVAPNKIVASNVAQKDSFSHPWSLSPFSRFLSPPEPPPRLS